MITSNIPYGYCHCGCGGKTRIATRNCTTNRLVKGEPMDFICGHRSPLTLEQRIIAFWSYVNKDGSIPAHMPHLGQCWEWISHLDEYSGYGRFRIDRKRKPNAHRAIWIMLNGEITDELEVCHKCDNPKCVRPDHLFLGTHKQNMNDMKIKGRGNGQKGERNNKSKLTSIQVAEIRERYATGEIYQSELAAEYRVTQTNISFIVKGVIWK